MDLLHQLIDKALLAFETPEIEGRPQNHSRIDCQIAPFRGDELLRSLYPLEQLEMFPNGEPAASQAA